MRTLSRHVLSRQLTLFASALLAFFAIGAVAEILVHLDRIVEQRAAAGGTLACLLLRVSARYAGDALPAASFAATFLCVGLAARAGETRALRTCGVAPGRLALPLLLAAATLSVAALCIGETWLLDARRAVARLESASPSESGEGPFWYHSGEALYNVGGRQADGGLRDVAIFELDERGRVRAATLAPSARADQEGWRLIDAHRQRFDPARPQWSSAAEPAGEHGLAALPLGRVSAPRADTGLLSLSELTSLGRGGGADARRQRIERQARLARPTSVFLLALLAFPLGLSVERGRGLAGAALLGAAALACLHGIDSAATLSAQRLWLPEWLGAWLGTLLLALGAAGLFARAQR